MVPWQPQPRQRFVSAGVELFHRVSSKMLVARLGWTNLLHLAIGLNRSRQPVLGLNCTDYLERQVYLASRGERTVRVVSTTLSAPLGRPSSLISPTGGRASRPTCTTGLRVYNPFTKAPGVRLTMALHQQMVRIVVLLDEIGHIHHQLGAGLPAGGFFSLSVRHRGCHHPRWNSR